MPLHVGGEVRIDDDAAAVVLLHAGLVEAEPFGVGHAADGDQHHIGLDRLRRAAFGRLDLGLERRARRIDAGDLRAELERDALLFQDALRLPARPRCPCRAGCGRGIRPPSPASRAAATPSRARARSRRRRSPGAAAAPCRARCAWSDDDDALAVDVDALEPRHVGAGGDDDVLGLQRLRLAVGAFDLDLAGRRRCGRCRAPRRSCSS